MDIEELQNKIKQFEKQKGFDKTDVDEFIQMVKDELVILEAKINNSDVVRHQLTDLLVLIMQIANRFDTDFEKEINKWFKKSDKYENVTPKSN